MSKDYKPRQSAARPKKSGGGLLLGLFVGFLLGLGVAAGIAVYVFKSPVPFTSKTAPPAKPDAKPGDKAPDAGTLSNAGKAGDGKQRFDFYRILPGQEEPVTDKQLKDAAKDAAKQPPAVQPPNSNADTAELPKDLYFMQAGAFQNPAEADNLKAKLALLGMEAVVEPSNIPEKGVWYRVRLGPFSRIDEINRVRSLLAQNGINASLVRIKDSGTKP